jgi:protein O-mannosyl-transferase
VSKTSRRKQRGRAGGETREPLASDKPAPPRDRRSWLVAVPLCLLVAAAFVPALGNGFVNWDDPVNFAENPHFRGLGWPQVRWAWTTMLLGVYQPVAWLLFEAQYAIWGLDARGYHLTSVLLHAANAVALFAVILDLVARILSDRSVASPWARAVGAGLATALFAVHPLRVEAVAWVSCQPYLSCALFSILMVLAYLRGVGDGERPRWGWLAASLILYAMALLSKAAAVTMPAVLVILDVYPLRRLGGGPGRWFGLAARRVWLEKIPFVALALVFIVIAVAAKADVGSLATFEDDGPLGRVAQACYAIWFYLVKTVFPRDITAFYPRPLRIDWLAPRFLLGLVATLAQTAVLFVLRRRWPGLLAAWLAYLVILLPGSGVVQVGGQLVADRYSYLPMLALAVPAAAGLVLAWASGRRARAVATVAVAGAGAAVLGLIPLSWAQCRIWSDSAVLWTHALDHAGTSATAHRSLAAVLFGRGQSAEAAPHYLESLRLNPLNPESHLNLGSIRYKQGDLAAATAHYRAALELNPGQAGAHNNLGLVLVDRGDLEGAITHYTEAIRLDPKGAEAPVNLGVALSRQGDFAAAIAQYNLALRLEPDNAEAQNNLAMILAACPDATYRDGRRAVELATRACELTRWEQPGTIDTLAAGYAETAEFAAAARYQARAIDLVGDESTKADYRSRLLLYQAGKPYREPAPQRKPTRAGRSR